MVNTKYSYIALFILAVFVGFFFYSHVFFVKNEPANQDLQNYLQNLENHSSQAIDPIPKPKPVNKQRLILGKKLFHDPNLSVDNSVSCASCHNLKLGGTDQQQKSVGANNQLTQFNTPTIFNSVYNFCQFWDGRSEDFTSQIATSLFASDEMANTNWDSLLSYLNNSKEYRLLFKSQYSLPITAKDLLSALAEYNTSLTTPNSRFDQYLQGNNFALNTYELEGYHLFNTYGCIACHQGINMGGNMFQKPRGFSDKTQLQSSNWDGRFSITHKLDDKGVFKVPTLRNIALTAPYFHDGSEKALNGAVSTMSKIQLGYALPDEDLHKIVAFLRTLTGEYNGQPL